jgi:hypothetical protein
MQLDALGSEEAAREALTREIEATWGPARAAALEATLATTAAAIWEIAQVPLDLLDAEPDFIGEPEG